MLPLLCYLLLDEILKKHKGRVTMSVDNSVLKKKAQKVFSKLKKEYPDAHCELDYKNPFQLLIATILSAQCTDVRVNIVTADLFRLYPNAKKMALAPLPQLENTIRSIGFFRNKAKNIKGCAEILTKNYQGLIPQSIEELIALPGVGRKTANVVLGNAFNINYGVVVDTHVKRISSLLGITKNKDPEKIEQDLMLLFPQKNWTLLSHLFIFHGRRVCIARRPKCQVCTLAPLCPSVH